MTGCHAIQLLPVRLREAVFKGKMILGSIFQYLEIESRAVSSRDQFYFTVYLLSGLPYSFKYNVAKYYQIDVLFKEQFHISSGIKLLVGYPPFAASYKLFPVIFAA